ncbi:ParB/RepB/Spo0J family partition protein [Streptomyces sp. NBC_01443]|nr:ParB/RepB/Spo0J family partition protein [Streptomyces sp. NBC_01443]
MAVKPAELAHNPFNPRIRLGDIEEIAQSLTTRGQIQAVTVVRREAFLAVHTGQEHVLGEADYVVVDGNRRLAAARVAGLAELRIDIRDELAASAEEMLEAALITSIHRADLGPLEEARAIQQLVLAYGRQKDVAAKLGKTAARVSQRLALLKLTDGLKNKVRSGELPVKDARRIGGLAAERQQAEAERAMSRAKSARRTPTRSATRSGAAVADTGELVNPVNPVQVFAAYVDRAVEFASSMKGVAAAYRDAATADQDEADRMVTRLPEYPEISPEPSTGATAATGLPPKPVRWLPDPVSRLGATFYAFAGAVLWETLSYAAHHLDVTITLV